MIELYQREGCPACQAVRRFLTEHGISFRAINVAKLGSERAELLALPGVSDPDVPLLIDGDVVLQESEVIIQHLRERLPDEHGFGDPAYGLTRTLPGVTYADAVPAVRAALATEGFGVLTEIDVKATMKKKLDADMRSYVILGACNPPLALKALTAEPAAGLLLPCNVVVTEDHEGNAVVSAIDPRSMFQVVDREEMQPLVKEVGDRLRRALAAIDV